MFSFFSPVMGLLYTAVSWILLAWYEYVWNPILPARQFLGTNWDWILSIVFLVVTIRVILFPLIVKQIKSQRAMQALQPQIKELQTKHKGDRATLNKEMAELLRKEKANPMMGCLPLFLQIPVFLSLYHVLKRLNPGNDRKTLYGWTVEQFESAAHAKLFGAPISARFLSPQSDLSPLGATQLNVRIVAAVLVAIMITTTYMSARQLILKTGWSEDPTQRMVQKLMLYGVPATLLISGGAFPIGVVIYWTTTNVFSLGQQWWVLRKYPPPKNASTKDAKRPKDAAAAKAEREAARAEAKALAPRPGAKPAKKAGAKTAGAKATGAKPAKAAGGKTGTKAAGGKATAVQATGTKKGTTKKSGDRPVDQTPGSET